MVGYSRHATKETNIKKAMIWVALGDVIFSFIAGLAIFGCVGFMSHQTGVPFHEIVKSDSTFQMGFVIFPQILQTFTPLMQPIVGGLFFFCIFIAGVTGIFSIVESIAGTMEVEFELTRKTAVSATIMAIFIMSIFFSMGNGVHILAALQPMVLGNAFLVGGLAQIYAFMVIDTNIKQDAVWQTQQKPGIAFYMAKYIGFVFLALILTGSLYEEAIEPWSLAHAVRFVWLTFTILVAIGANKFSKKNNAFLQIEGNKHV